MGCITILKLPKLSSNNKMHIYIFLKRLTPNILTCSHLVDLINLLQKDINNTVLQKYACDLLAMLGDSVYSIDIFVNLFIHLFFNTAIENIACADALFHLTEKNNLIVSSTINLIFDENLSNYNDIQSRLINAINDEQKPACVNNKPIYFRIKQESGFIYFLSKVDKKYFNNNIFDIVYEDFKKSKSWAHKLNLAYFVDLKFSFNINNKILDELKAIETYHDLKLVIIEFFNIINKRKYLDDFMVKIVNAICDFSDDSFNNCWKIFIETLTEIKFENIYISNILKNVDLNKNIPNFILDIITNCIDNKKGNCSESISFLGWILERKKTLEPELYITKMIKYCELNNSFMEQVSLFRISLMSILALFFNHKKQEWINFISARILYENVPITVNNNILFMHYDNPQVLSVTDEDLLQKLLDNLLLLKKELAFNDIKPLEEKNFPKKNKQLNSHAVLFKPAVINNFQIFPGAGSAIQIAGNNTSQVLATGQGIAAGRDISSANTGCHCIIS